MLPGSNAVALALARGVHLNPPYCNTYYVYFLFILLLVAHRTCICVFCRLLSNYESTNENAKNKSDNHYLSSTATTISAAKYTSATPAMELMKVFRFTSLASARASCCLGTITMCRAAASLCFDNVNVHFKFLLDVLLGNTSSYLSL